MKYRLLVKCAKCVWNWLFEQPVNWINDYDPDVLFTPAAEVKVTEILQWAKTRNNITRISPKAAGGR